MSESRARTADLGLRRDSHKALLQQGKLVSERHMLHLAPILTQQVGSTAHKGLMGSSPLKGL